MIGSIKLFHDLHDVSGAMIGFNEFDDQVIEILSQSTSLRESRLCAIAFISVP